MSINKKEYLFTAERYKEWASVLEDKSLAFNLYAFKEYKVVKTKTGETGKLTKIKMGITISESLLPRHCNPELVELALASLEKNPENPNLLKTLGDYTKNNRFERVGYGRVGVALMIIFCIAAVATASALTFAFNPVFILVHPLATLLSMYPIFMAAIARFAISAAEGAASPVAGITLNTFLIALAAVFISAVLSLAFASIPLTISIVVIGFPLVLNAHRVSHLGLKMGRWIGYLVKGINNQPGNLQELDEKLNELINEQAKMSQHEENLESNIATVVAKIYPPLQSEESLEPPVSTVTAQTITPAMRCRSLLFTNNPEVTVQDTTSNTNNSFQQVPK